MQPSITKFRLDITYLKLLSNVPGAIELINVFSCGLVSVDLPIFIRIIHFPVHYRVNLAIIHTIVPPSMKHSGKKYINRYHASLFFSLPYLSLYMYKYIKRWKYEKRNKALEIEININILWTDRMYCTCTWETTNISTPYILKQTKHYK